MECWAPAFPQEMLEDKSDTGEIFIQMDGKSEIWRGHFNYHSSVQVIPFENDDKLLHLKSGDTEVSLHVCNTHLHSLTSVYYFSDLTY